MTHTERLAKLNELLHAGATLDECVAAMGFRNLRSLRHWARTMGYSLQKVPQWRLRNNDGLYMAAPEEPTDEPVSVLVARIAAEPGAAQESEEPKRRRRRKASTSQTSLDI